ncbi:MAG: hypothetical protein ABH865_02070 [Candidatus Omnitrophota bacterium]|nr:hypothetical protein [Candidatus Omnitrophota bacterium]
MYILLILALLACGCAQTKKPYTQGYTTFYPVRSTKPVTYQTPYDIIKEGNKVTSQKSSLEPAP